MKTLTCFVAGAVITSVCIAANAQTSHYTEYSKTIAQTKDVRPLDNSLFGEEINLYTGSTEFAATDVSLKGNNALAVAIGRRYVVEDKTGYAGPGVTTTQFGDWEMDIPYLHGVFPRYWGWASRYFPNGERRCTISPTQPDAAKPPVAQDAQTGATLFGSDEYWHGNFLHIPGQGDQEMMVLSTGNTIRPQSGGPYYWITKGQWFFSCLTGSANGTPGEAFVAVGPDGTKYRFDWFVSYPVSQLEKGHNTPGFEVTPSLVTGSNDLEDSLKTIAPKSSASAVKAANFAFLRRYEVRIYPTQVEDRFGNKVVYTFDPQKPRNLLKIEGFNSDGTSDGRKIEFTYHATNGMVTQVKAGTQSWDYIYTGSLLTDVLLPDESSWHYALGGVGSVEIATSNASGECGGIPINDGQQTVTGTIKHPSGATGTFAFKPTLHGRSNIAFPGNCVNLSYFDGVGIVNYFVSVVPELFGVVSIQSKQISGPGLPTATWQYQYSPAVNCAQVSPCPGQKTVTVTGPTKWERHTFSNRFSSTDGMLEKLEVGAIGTSISKSTQETTYLTNASGQAFPARVGVAVFGRGDLARERYTPTLTSKTTLDGRAFNWQVAENCSGGMRCFDKFARPTKVTKSSAPSP